MVIKKLTCSKVTLDQLLSEQIPSNIVKALGGKGTRKENNSSKDVLFTKADVSTSESAPIITSNFEEECDNQEPLPPLPKLTKVEPSDASKGPFLLSDLTANMADLTLNTASKKSALPLIEQLLLTLMEEVKGCEICGSIAHEIADCPKNLRNNRKPRVAIKQSEPTKKYSKESGPKVVFGDNSSGDTEGHGSVNCNGITFTKVAYVNALKHSLISISQLCDVNFKVLFTKTEGSILNEKDEVVLISPRRRDVYVIDMSSYNTDSNACFYAKALPSMENLNDTKVNQLRSDNGIEFRNHTLEAFCDEKGISQNFSLPCTPEQNGVAERRNKTLIEAARTMLNSASLPKQGRALDISYFHVFGCPMHIHNHRDYLGKFDEKTDDGFFLGYSLVAKAFRVFNIRRQDMEEAFHVTLSEDDEAIS
ncbi:retrovirus-related pol polyprotein from transposon TNT 1-94 [Tanacetum coccineum]